MTKGGFFDRGGVGHLVDPRKVHSSAAGGCESCGLFKTCRRPKMAPTGKGELGVLVVAEAPGETEDAQGVQLVGPAGQVCREVLQSLGYDLDVDCQKTNALRCRPPGNRTPTDQEIACCRPALFKEIASYKPAVIIPMGAIALEALIGHRWRESLGGITRWRGWSIPDYETGAWICPTFHPSFVLREMRKTYGGDAGGSAVEQDHNPTVGTIYAQDLAAAFKRAGKTLPKGPPSESMVEVDEKGDQAVECLRDIAGTIRTVGFDFETTGLKPYRAGHRIVTCAVADRPDHAIAFPMTDATREALIPVLTDPQIGKCAHNMKFEDQWSSRMLGTRIRGWLWDSAIAAHVEDGRDGVVSLKFQAAVRFGLLGFKDDTDEYLKETTDDYGANSFNRIDDCPRRLLLLRNGVDALLTLRLSEVQMAEAQKAEAGGRR